MTYLGDILPLCTSGDLFCTSTSSWWRILYIRNFLTIYSVQSILYIYFSLVSLAFIWVIFYDLHDLFCTNTSSWWPTHVDLFSINTTFSDLVSFIANIFYLHLLDVLMFTWNVFYHIYPTPPLEQDMTQGQFFKRSLTGLISEFSFS